MSAYTPSDKGAIEDLAENDSDLLQDAQNGGCEMLAKLLDVLTNAYQAVDHEIWYYENFYPNNPAVQFYVDTQLKPLRAKLGADIDNVIAARNLLGC